MKYLLDTHTLLWFMRETQYLPPADRRERAVEHVL